MKTIYTFGDSHVCMFCEEYRANGESMPDERKVIFADKSLGVPTAYSIQRHDDAIQERLSSIPFEDGDEMWFIFGEIDVRFHIFYHHQRLEITLDESINIVVNRYVSYVKKLRDQGYNIHIVSVVPPQPNPSPYRWDPTYEVQNEIRGNGITVKDRIYMTERMNQELKRVCDKEGVPFRNIYPFIVDPKTRCHISEMTRDEMHYHYIGDLIIEKLNLEDSYED